MSKKAYTKIEDNKTIIVRKHNKRLIVKEFDSKTIAIEVQRYVCEGNMMIGTCGNKKGIGYLAFKLSREGAEDLISALLEYLKHNKSKETFNK
jgi:hypothetical protein